jgi:hypothetical protein
MATRNEWLALAERCEKATASDWDIDEAIMRALGLLVFVTREGRLVYDAETDAIEKVPELTESTDAITALIGREFPQFELSISVGAENCSVRLYAPGLGVGFGVCFSHAATEALARTAAFCRAMAARAEA